MNLGLAIARALSPGEKRHFPMTNHTCAFCRARFLDDDRFNRHVEAHTRARAA